MKTDIYTLAHEVKNPLCVVKGYLEMLNKENFLKYKEIINNELNESINILDNYLEYKKMIINKEIMDINLLLSDIKRSYQAYLKKQGINLKINLIDDDIYLMGDYNKLKQVFYNIIKNSCEAFSKNIWIDYKIKEDKIAIRIKNDGLKIMDDNLDKIGTNYTSKVMGNGIGVNLSKKIIELHGGKIKYKNNFDAGISVIITLLLG